MRTELDARSAVAGGGLVALAMFGASAFTSRPSEPVHVVIDSLPEVVVRLPLAEEVIDRMRNFDWEAARNDQNWEQLRRVLPFEDRPNGVELVSAPTGLGITSVDSYSLRSPDQGLFVSLLRFSPWDDDEMQKMFDLGDPDASSIIKLINPRLGEMEIQGRTVRTLQADASEMEIGDKLHSAGPLLRIDLSTEDRRLVATFSRTGDSERLTLASVREFLSQFSVWE